MTKVINLFAGPGTGKSTTAAGLFYEMKLVGFDVELVREYAKTFAYGGSLPEQAYLYAKQAKAENQLYGKVEWIVTDSPLYLSAIYGDPVKMMPLILENVQKRREYNFLLKRHKPYHQNGRFQTENEAKLIDSSTKLFLTQNSIPYVEILANDRERVSTILALLENV